MSASGSWKKFAVKASIAATAFLLVLIFAASECIKANKAPLPVMQKLKLLLPDLFWATVASAIFLVICVVKSIMLDWTVNPALCDEASEREKIRLFGRIVLGLIGILAAFFAVVGIGGLDPVAKFLYDHCSQENPRPIGVDKVANGRSIALDFFYCLAGVWVFVKLLRWTFKKSPKVVKPEAFELSESV
jgi:hypothetical protein